MFVGVIGVEDRGKKPTEKNRVGFSVSFFLGNRKTDNKKSVFGRENREKPTEKTDFWFSVHNPGYEYITS